ncbi:Sorting nexin-9 [Trichinella zimbabwensis]|uniref:Sorting nexin-9 n=1 Tax=Trichinella zimbabwensis TaxID=268475 RepID=A0A0V1HV59_9BILA|nr:Sorting nexin-9 [Trichinella zimbabwensis]
MIVQIIDVRSVPHLVDEVIHDAQNNDQRYFEFYLPEIVVHCLLCPIKVQVLYDFDAQPGSGELSVQTGEYLTVTRQACHFCFLYLFDVGDGWWEGLNSRGEHGLFPQAYVQVFYDLLILFKMNGCLVGGRQSDSRLLRKKVQSKLSIEREGIFDSSKKPLSQASSNSGVR